MKVLHKRAMLALAAGLVLLGAMAIVGTSTAAGSAAVSPVEVRVLGQDSWLADSRVGVRVLVTNHDRGEALPAWLRVTAQRKGQGGQVKSLYVGRTGPQGTAEVEFSTAGLAPGEYVLGVRAVTNAGMDLVERPVRVRREAKVMLTTDKPLYQPGQTIHIRALAVQMPSAQPTAGRAITLEVEDAKGNKVFKQAGKCSQFGVAHADFELAYEVNMGRFVVRAVMEEGQAEKTVTVERYVLPKFKVTLTTDRKYYRPGERITGRVQADYFFGKPVSRSQVAITAEAFEAGWRTVAELKGETDQAGSYRYEIEIPAYLVGQPSEGGKAVIKLTAVVTDRARHEQQVAQSVPISQGSLVVRLVPEGGRLQAGLPGELYVISSTPDGQAAPAQVSLGAASKVNQGAGEATLGGWRRGIRTGQLGLGRVTVEPPAGCRRLLVRVQAESKEGSFDAELPVPCATYGQDDEPVALLVDRPVVKVGEEIRLNVLAAARRGPMFVDLVKDRQTMLTRTVELKEGRGEISVTAGPELVGMVTVSAYRVSPSENIMRDSRLVWVQGADDLKIEAKPDQQTYRPGAEATIRFRVTDKDNHPLLAALGIAVVDESVFALSEMQPGLEQIYFRLERELMSPKYEIHGLALPQVLQQPVGRDQPAEQQQMAARVLFASAPRAQGFSLDANSYQDRLVKMRKAWRERMEQDRKRIEQALKAYYTKHGSYLAPDAELRELVEEGLLPAGALKDEFGHAYQVRWRQAWVWLRSAGPDGKLGNADDVMAEQDVLMVGDGMVDRRQMLMLEAVPAPAAPADMARAKGAYGGAGPEAAAEPAVRVREYFPETMFVQPELITDEQGQASVRMTMADSITTWRLTALGSSRAGQLGSLNTGLRVFQDFFVDLDLPVALTQGDEVSVPVAIYNYLPQAQTVTLNLEQADWFDLTGEARRQVKMPKDGIDVVYYQIKAKAIGSHKLTVTARGTTLSDAIRREIEVLPDGKETRGVQNGRLEPGKPLETTVAIPAAAIPGASTIFVKLYPGHFSQVVEGLDKIFRMPNGCFEQTSSVTYPNVLVLDYLKRTKQAKPELEMKAAQYINVGYQRLVSYEVPGGGFSWFGNAPAHKVLTAYGLLEFHDMSLVHEVDPAVISRTQRWLAEQQQAGGTWEVDKGGIAEGIINRQTDTTRVTGYLAWALAESGYQGPQVAKALDYLRGKYQQEQDPYALAVILNAFTAAGDKSGEVGRVAQALADKAVVEGDLAYWKSTAPTFTGAGGGSADLETTALASYALLKSSQQGALVNKALLYLTKQKDSYGTWSTTQATVWGIKALLLAMDKATEEINATVTVSINGKQAGEFRITSADADVMRQLDLKEHVQPGANQVTISAQGKGSALYQVVSRYYLPWDQLPREPGEVLEIKVNYDRTTLAQNDLLGCHVEVKNLTDRVAQMVIVDLGLPPGFELVPDGLEQAVKQGAITKYTPAARQIIVYTDSVGPRATLTLDYQLRAKYPLRARSPKSRAYLYYNPEQEALAAPQVLTVQ